MNMRPGLITSIITIIIFMNTFMKGADAMDQIEIYSAVRFRE